MNTVTKAIIAVLGGTLFAGCGYLQPSTQNAGASGPKLSKCEQNATVDDFEDANNQIMLKEGRGEYIYTFKDGLGTEIEFPDGDFRVYPGGVGGSKYVARFRGTTAEGGGDIFAGLGFGLSAAGPETAYDASKYTGVTFLAKKGSSDATSIVRFGIADVNTDPRGNICSECYNHFGTPVKLTEQWTRYVIFFDEMEQAAGWGDPRPEQLDKSGLLGFVWQVSIPKAKFDFMIDDVRFIGACGEEFAKRPEAAPASMPEPESATEDNSDKETAATPATTASADDAVTAPKATESSDAAAE